MSGQYAQGTEVTPERSQQEISGLLRKYGATGFVYGWQSGEAMVSFIAHDRQVRFVLTLPTDYRAFARTPSNRVRTPAQQKTAMEQEIRRKWRALALAIKAKLEVVASEIATFEEEFLAHIVLPDGRTAGQHVIPAVTEAYDAGQVSRQLLPSTRELTS